ncbi:MAG TPA: 16S rRNA (cytidine(1402)-2'-O)-methyltransferase [Acidimicrobiales bacterium]|nr:16S rRNA (cytidine(1402)-2'-O)-methyltransferase [Acidimicrobiales bacterium]
MSGGALVVVATPIGNLGDLSPRAVEALAAADVIACEDTRRTRKLLTHSGIGGKRLLSVHDRNEAARAGEVVGLVRAGRRVALVSDAGTPGISDPGERLVAATTAAGLPVEVVPGPSAVVAALVASGLPAGRFVFEGFLPRKGRERGERLAAVAGERRTTVLFEAPHRVVDTLADLAEACGTGRRAALARELTKLHEEVWRGTLGDAVEREAARPPQGEYVIVVDGASSPAAPEESDIEDALAVRMGEGEQKRAAVAAVAAELGVPKRRVYDVAVRLGDRG